MIKIIIFGNTKLAIDCIREVSSNKDTQLVAVVGCDTMLDIKEGNPSIKKYCERKKIKYYNPEKLDDKFYEVIRKLNPDLCFSILYRKIFKINYISLPKMGFINMHPSLLPRYRGPVPRLWMMLNGESFSGVTYHYIDEGIDSGNIIAQDKFAIPKNISGYDFNKLIIQNAFRLFKKILPDILNFSAKSKKQDHKRATYFAQYNDSLRDIDWLQKSDLILRRILAMTNPYKGARGMLNGSNIIIWNAKKVSISKKRLSGPGKIIKVFKDNKFIVSTVDGFLIITDFKVTMKRHELIRQGDRFEIY